LTEALAKRGAEVWAVEVDRGLAHSLRERFADVTRVHILEQDALAIEVGAIFGGGRPFSVVANLPYNVGTAIVRRLLESEPRPSRLVVMLQKEVALAIVASPGHMSLVSVGVQVFATGRRLFDVAPGAFFPPPKVMSTVIRLDARSEPFVPAEERPHFFEVVRGGFSAPRKQLRNSLANGLGVDAQETTAALDKAGIDPTMRPQELSIEQWLALSRRLRG
jgi:16S rRNA (adenine1518-N6/adenine1519-N6)-dimethyltransferase